MDSENEFDYSKYIPKPEAGADMRKLVPLIDQLTGNIEAWQKLAPRDAPEPGGITRMKSLRARMETALDLLTHSQTLPEELSAKTLIREFIVITTNK